jgi:gas vesicle protein
MSSYCSQLNNVVMETKSVLLGLLAGAAAGAVLGVLFAPEKGTKFRRRISKNGEDLVEGLKEKISGLHGTVSEKFEEAKENASDFAEKHGKPKTKDA